MRRHLDQVSFGSGSIIWIRSHLDRCYLIRHYLDQASFGSYMILFMPDVIKMMPVSNDT